MHSQIVMKWKMSPVLFSAAVFEPWVFPAWAAAISNGILLIFLNVDMLSAGSLLTFTTRLRVSARYV